MDELFRCEMSQKFTFKVEVKYVLIQAEADKLFISSDFKTNK